MGGALASIASPDDCLARLGLGGAGGGLRRTASAAAWPLPWSLHVRAVVDVWHFDAMMKECMDAVHAELCGVRELDNSQRGSLKPLLRRVPATLHLVQ